MRQFFISFFSILIAYIMFNLLGQTTEPYRGYGWAVFSRFTLFFESLTSSVLTVLLTGFLLYQSGDNKWWEKGLFKAAAVLWGIYTLFLISTWFSDIFYSIDDQNVYRRGMLYPLLLIPPVVIMVINLAALWNRRKLLSARQKTALFIYAAVPLVSMLLQMVFFGLYLIVLGTAIASMFMLTYVITDQTERYYVQKLTNERLQTELMLSQIQPHFLYNSLSVIQAVCETDPDKAARAIREFTGFLRHNMDSITESRPIPFEAEWQHVCNYVDLQRLRFGDALQIETDLECTDFRLPTLTLQPLVENAISYGIRKTSTGAGTVSIRTRDEKDHYEIIVQDNGPGIEEVWEQNRLYGGDSRSHVGISNVRERLRQVCGGNLRLISEPGVGTTATIVIPKEGKYADIGSG